MRRSNFDFSKTVILSRIFLHNVTILVTPGVRHKKCQKIVTVRGISGFSIVFGVFFRKFDKKSAKCTL